MKGRFQADKERYGFSQLLGLLESASDDGQVLSKSLE